MFSKWSICVFYELNIYQTLGDIIEFIIYAFELVSRSLGVSSKVYETKVIFYLYNGMIFNDIICLLIM